MMKTSLYTRFADWRFLHRARLDTMPLNGTDRFGEGSKQCRRCNNVLETLPHVFNLSHCKYVSRSRALHHHNVVHRLARGTPAIAGTITEDKKIPGTSGQLQPDLVITNVSARFISIIGVAIVFENKFEAFQHARAGKIEKYQVLADELHSQGWDVYLTAIIVGALGGWDSANDTVIRQLRISKSDAKLMKKLVISDTIRWSRDGSTWNSSVANGNTGNQSRWPNPLRNRSLPWHWILLKTHEITPNSFYLLSRWDYALLVCSPLSLIFASAFAFFSFFLLSLFLLSAF